MSEDRLERALQEMKEEDVDAGTLEAARARVWEKVTNAGSATCAEFRQDFHAYLANELAGSRRLLVEDHLSRCPGCRARIAEMKGERPIVAMPAQRSSSRWMRWGALAAAAALLFAVLYLGRDTIDGMMAPGGPRATVVSADGGLYRLPVSVSRSRRRHRRTRVGPHRPGSPRGVAARRRIDGGCQRANGAVRDRRLERPGDSPPARRHHRQGRQTAPRPPASSDPRFHRLGEGNRLRGVRRHGRLGGFGGRGIGGGEPAWQGGAPQPGPAGRLHPGAGELGRGSRLLEPRRGVLPGAARVVREDRTRAGEFPRRAADQLGPALVSSRRRCRLRRGPESRRHDRPGPFPRRGAVGPERDVRGLVEFRDRTAVETDDGPRPVGEPAARGRNRLLRQRPRARTSPCRS